MQLNCTGDFCFNGLALSGADRKRKILQLKILRHLCHVLRGEIAQRQDEAAQDLGANSFQVISRVIVPLSMPGVASGITMVFVPSVSTFIISRMLGGGTNMLIGDLIELQFLGNSYNYNLGSAMSLVLMVIVLLCMSFTTADTEEMEAMV